MSFPSWLLCPILAIVQFMEATVMTTQSALKIRNEFLEQRRRMFEVLAHGIMFLY